MGTKIQYLVIEMHTMDDIPILLTEDRGAAELLCETHKPMGSEWEQYCKDYCDCSTPLCMKIITFDNGRPVKYETFRDFDGE